MIVRYKFTNAHSLSAFGSENDNCTVLNEIRIVAMISELVER